MFIFVSVFDGRQLLKYIFIHSYEFSIELPSRGNKLLGTIAAVNLATKSVLFRTWSWIAYKLDYLISQRCTQQFPNLAELVKYL